MGDRSDSSNPFQWHKVRLNLPGSKDYDPTLPWVAKIRLDGRIACDLLIYVDDFRTTGFSSEICWQATRQTGSRCNYLGVQDASRKRRKQSQTPGAWAGSIIMSDGEDLVVMVSQEKWDKTRAKVRWIHSFCLQSQPIPFKELERVRGFLVYTTRTYPEMVPYLKGIHLTLDGWRDGRDNEGWKWVKPKEEMEEDMFSEAVYGEAQDSAPENVVPVPRLASDIAALVELTVPLQPPKHTIRSKASLSVAYGFGDASGQGFGCGVQVDERFHYRFGNWATAESEKSSNYRELNNLVLGLESWAQENLINHREIFLFTDNTTAEGAYYRGTSTNKVLFGLVLRLRKLELHHKLKLHVVHISGTRMIASGIDGLSRGDTGEGILGGQSVLSFVPLSQTAVERSGYLMPWIQSWAGLQLKLLNADGWFEEGHSAKGVYLWAPAPAAAEAAVEQLCLARHKRTTATHIVAIPRLMTAQWRKVLGKVADTLFTVPIKTKAWSYKMHEPLIIAIVLPLNRFYPWTYRRSALVGALEGQLRRVWEAMPEGAGAVLCKFFKQTSSLATMPEGVVRKVLCAAPRRQLPSSGGKKRGRPGDWSSGRCNKVSRG